jgi:predicted transcriptional regulator
MAEKRTPQKKKRKKMGRPTKRIDLKQLEALAALQCTNDEIASGLGIARSTLQERLKSKTFRTAIEKGRELGRRSLRRMQYEAAKKGNVTMMIWLGKQWLAQRDKIEQDVTTTTKGPLVIVLTDEQGDVDDDGDDGAIADEEGSG